MRQDGVANGRIGQMRTHCDLPNVILSVATVKWQVPL
jgi:hypothetical protein